MALLSRTRRPKAEEVDEVARLFDEREAAVSELARLDATRPDVVLDGTEDEVAAHDAAILRARIRIDRASAHHARAVSARQDAIAREDDERRRALHRRGVIAAREARRLYEIDYVEAASKVADVLRRIVELEAEIAAANRDLPHETAEIERAEPDNGSPARPIEYGPEHRGVRAIVSMPSPAVPHLRLLDRVRLPGVGRNVPDIR